MIPVAVKLVNEFLIFGDKMHYRNVRLSFIVIGQDLWSALM